MQNRLKELRAASKLTLLEVAKLTDQDVTTVSKHESGTRGLTHSTIDKYARVYKVSTYEILHEKLSGE